MKYQFPILLFFLLLISPALFADLGDDLKKVSDNASIKLGGDTLIQDKEPIEIRAYFSYSKAISWNLADTLYLEEHLAFDVQDTTEVKLNITNGKQTIDSTITLFGPQDIALGAFLGQTNRPIKDQSFNSWKVTLEGLNDVKYDMVWYSAITNDSLFFKRDSTRTQKLSEMPVRIETFSPEVELIKMETNKGNMLIWLYDATPKHKANFMKLTKEGFYNGLIFHRVIKNFMIQGGDPDGNGRGGPGYKTDAEILPELSHDFGALAAARQSDFINPQRQSSGSQFYIVENPNGTPHLDGNYTVFGYVIDGRETITAIGAVETAPGDKPLQDVIMQKVEVVKMTKRDVEEKYEYVIK